MAAVKTRKSTASQAAHADKTRAQFGIYYVISVLLVASLLPMMQLPDGVNLVRPRAGTMHLVASAFSVGRFGWPGLEWREIIDWWTSGYSRGVVIGRNYIPPCKLCDMPRMFRVD